jgi:hypothetical protein
MHSYAEMLEEVRQIADGAQHVWLDPDRLNSIVEIMRTRLDTKVGDFGVRRDYPDLDPADMLQFHLVVGAHNFLFWQREETGRIVPWQIYVNNEWRHGFPAYLACHSRALQHGKNILDPHFLTSMTLADMEAYYRDEQTGQVTLQSLPERLERYHEVGQVLLDSYGGSFLPLLERAQGFLFRADGQGIIQQLLQDFPLTYGDWPFCKKALVTVGNLYQDRAQLIPLDSPYRHLIELRDPEKLEVGADYYRPYFFYRVGLLRLSPDFRKRVIKRVFIERDSPMEREYRAWTILAGRLLADRLGVTPHDIAVETWAMGYMRCRACYIGVAEKEVPCSYRPVCRSYNDEPAMMESLWPLVLTTNY